MNRAISFVLSASSVALTFACSGSTGSGQQTGYVVPPGSTASTYEAPATNPDQPLANPDAPPTNPDQSSSSTTVDVCTNFCASVPDCLDSCLSDCRKINAFATPCPSETASLLTCAEQGGLSCSDSGNLRLAGNACESAQMAFETCATNFIASGGTLPGLLICLSTSTTVASQNGGCSTEWSSCTDGHTYGVSCAATPSGSTCACTVDGHTQGSFSAIGANDCPSDAATVNAACGWSLL